MDSSLSETIDEVDGMVSGFIAYVEKENELEEALYEVVEVISDRPAERMAFTGGAFWGIALTFLRGLLDNCAETKVRRVLSRAARNPRRKARYEEMLTKRFEKNEELNAVPANKFASALMHVALKKTPADWDDLYGRGKPKGMPATAPPERMRDQD